MDAGAGQVGQSFGQTGTLSSHLSRPDLVAIGVQKGGETGGNNIKSLTSTMIILLFTHRFTVLPIQLVLSLLYIPMNS